MSELPPERKPDKLSIRDKAAEAAPDMPGGSRTFFYARHWRPSPTASFTTAKWLYCSFVPQHHTIVKDWGYPSLLLWQDLFRNRTLPVLDFNLALAKDILERHAIGLSLV